MKIKTIFVCKQNKYLSVFENKDNFCLQTKLVFIFKNILRWPVSKPIGGKYTSWRDSRMGTKVSITTYRAILRLLHQLLINMKFWQKIKCIFGKNNCHHSPMELVVSSGNFKIVRHLLRSWQTILKLSSKTTYSIGQW